MIGDRLLIVDAVAGASASSMRRGPRPTSSSAAARSGCARAGAPDSSPLSDRAANRLTPGAVGHRRRPTSGTPLGRGAGAGAGRAGLPGRATRTRSAQARLAAALEEIADGRRAGDRRPDRRARLAHHRARRRVRDAGRLAARPPPSAPGIVVLEPRARPADRAHRLAVQPRRHRDDPGRRACGSAPHAGTTEETLEHAARACSPTRPPPPRRPYGSTRSAGVATLATSPRRSRQKWQPALVARARACRDRIAVLADRA